MATAKEVQNTIIQFSNKVDRATSEIEDLVKLIRQLEKALDTFNADEDLDITRSIKSQISKGQDSINDLRKAVDKLEAELSDTNRKYSNLAR